ncbi:MAG: DUF192 domain-containing protein [Pseudomonadota bacterium]
MTRRCLAVAALFAALASAGWASCAVDVVDIRQNDTSVRFAVEVADDPAERAQGLMNRPELPTFSGMLFVYDRPQPVSFWMKNTLIPLDMLFLDETGTVRRIHHRAQPLSTEPIPGGNEIFAVLEINGGLSDDLGLDVGAQLRHPAFAEDLAAWPCAPAS